MAQLRLGDDSWRALVERIVERACAVAAGIDRAACRELVELILIVRVRKTEACGRHAACAVRGAPGGEQSGWMDADPAALPAMFAAAVVDRLEPVPAARAGLEARLADAFVGVMAGVTFENPRCGVDEVCRAEPVFPLRRS